jgi:hypothetical protein
MSGGSSDFDNRYSITGPPAMKIIRKIENRGCEIGVHASYNSYNRSDYISSEKTKLDKILHNKSIGCRQHYLRWKNPDTWRLQQKAEFSYDTTLGFADRIGFRCGICLPFQPFDVVENRKLTIWELPMIVHDGALQSSSYQNLSPDSAYKEIIKHLDIVRRFNGVFVLLWHNSSFDAAGGWADWDEVYEKVMKYLSEQNAYVEMAGNLIKWWEKT